MRIFKLVRKVQRNVRIVEYEIQNVIVPGGNWPQREARFAVHIHVHAHKC
jgi:hypothetical protein